MRVLVLGASGMLGHKLLQFLSQRYEVVGTIRAAAPAVLNDFTLLPGVHAEDFASVVRAVAHCRPHAVINCIGLVKQLKPNRRDLIAINALFPHQLLELSQACGARLIHFSTDCVFSGQTGRYTEESRPDPLDDYGRAKLLGELQVGALTLRTSIVGWEILSRHGLVEWLFSQSGPAVKGFREAIFSGLTTLETSRVVGHILEQHPELEGVWHLSSQPISKFDLLCQIQQRAALPLTIEPDDSLICDRSLDSTRFRQATGYRPPTWKAMVDEMIQDRLVAPC